MIVDGEIRMIEDDAQAIAESVIAAGSYVESRTSPEVERPNCWLLQRDALAIWLRLAAIARQADGGR